MKKLRVDLTDYRPFMATTYLTHKEGENMSNEIIPRRIRLDMMTPEELTIFNMLDKIEKLGAHPLLTDVIVLLNEAREKLADWVDLQAVAKP